MRSRGEESVLDSLAGSGFCGNCGVIVVLSVSFISGPLPLLDLDDEGLGDEEA